MLLAIMMAAAIALALFVGAAPTESSPRARSGELSSGLLAGPIAGLFIGLPFQGAPSPQSTSFGFQLGARLGSTWWRGPIRDAPSGTGGAVLFDAQFASGVSLFAPSARAELYLENPFRLLLPSVHAYALAAMPVGRFGGESALGMRFGVGAGVNAFVTGRGAESGARKEKPDARDELWRWALLALSVARAELHYERLFVGATTVQTFRLMLGLGI